jgi:hypothetical protein
VIIHTPIDGTIGKDGTQLLGIPGGWVVGLLSTDDGDCATKFAQSIVDLNGDECEAAWIDTSDCPGVADVVMHACGFTQGEVLNVVDTMSNVLDMIVIDSVYSYSERTLPWFLKELQTICVETKLITVVTGLAREDNSPIGGRAWQNHCDLVIQLWPGNLSKVVWWPESEPTGELIQWM